MYEFNGVEYGCAQEAALDAAVLVLLGPVSVRPDLDSRALLTSPDTVLRELVRASDWPETLGDGTWSWDDVDMAEVRDVLRSRAGYTELRDDLRKHVPASIAVETHDLGVTMAGQVLTAEVAGALYARLWRYSATFGTVFDADKILEWLRENETWPCEVCATHPRLLTCGDCSAQAWCLTCGHGRTKHADDDSSGYGLECTRCRDARCASLLAVTELNRQLPDGISSCTHGHDVIVYDERDHCTTASPATARELAGELESHPELDERQAAEYVWAKLCR